MKMVNNALSIGSVFGIPIRLHVSLLIVVGLLAFFSGEGLLTILALVAGIFGSVALHELGHSVVARAKGSYIHEIVLYPFGGAAKIANIPKKPMDEVLVALAGPAVSLVLAVGFLQTEWLHFLGYLNGILFCFNLLPVFPMDGGRVFRAALTVKKGRLEATRIAATVGKYFCGLFVLVGLFGFKGQLFGFIGPFDPNPVLVFVGFYIWHIGRVEYRMVLMEHHANRFSGYHDGKLGVEVGPPPYAASESGFGGLADKLRKLFRR